ncbi:hypothetical protein [Haladaptatus salinisoli]|uniref:hypothetical protein n=1 Tax=Haladaptatus salinisoli TaxID=2884876 RepID=UPI001D0B82E4|nr:hypothetical protein [Haladaptatus salinisoli]
MQRREILQRTGAAAAVGLLGGCLGRGGAPGEGTPDDGSGDAGGDTTTTTERPTIENRSFKVLGANCGNETQTATVSFEPSKKNVVVTGTITGSDSCAKPVLAGANVGKDGALTVKVETKKKDGATACTQCLTELEYRATLSFGGPIPESVKVVHRSLGETKTVATTKRDGSSATTTSDGT